LPRSGEGSGFKKSEFEAGQALLVPGGPRGCWLIEKNLQDRKRTKRRGGTEKWVQNTGWPPGPNEWIRDLIRTTGQAETNKKQKVLSGKRIKKCPTKRCGFSRTTPPHPGITTNAQPTQGILLPKWEASNTKKPTFEKRDSKERMARVVLLGIQHTQTRGDNFFQNGGTITRQPRRREDREGKEQESKNRIKKSGRRKWGSKNKLADNF